MTINLKMNWLIRTIIKAAPNCTLWKFDINQQHYVFRFWPYWVITYEKFIDAFYYDFARCKIKTRVYEIPACGECGNYTVYKCFELLICDSCGATAAIA